MEKTNDVKVSGILTKEFTFSHECRGEKYFLSEISMRRDSGTIDYIPVLFPEILTKGLEARDYVSIEGEYRSYNMHTEEKDCLLLSIFVQGVSKCQIDVIGMPKRDINSITLEGYLCKPTVYRKTPLGRDISDMMLAVNRMLGKSDYIPCIAWGRNALRVSDVEVGTKVKVTGRIQSRTYEKKLDNGSETRTAYEVSVSSILFL